MYYLEEKQIVEISNKLREEEINYSHLFDDLLDHVCCDVERYMQTGAKYSEAKNKVYQEIGLNGLREIQEATIFYVKFNLLLMKKVMKVMGLIGAPLLFIGLLFKLMHWPGANMLFALGNVLLITGFFPLALLSVRKELKLRFLSKDFLIYLVGFLTIVETCIALLFSHMHWPGTTIHIIISMVSMMLVFFPMLFYRIIKSEKNRIANLSLALFAFILFSIINVQTYNRKTSLVNVAENAGLEREISVYKKAIVQSSQIKTAGFEQFNTSVTELENLIAEYQNKILGPEENIYRLSINFLARPAIDSFSDNGFFPLKVALHKVHAEALLLANDDVFLNSFIKEKLTTDTYQVDVYGNLTWQTRYFQGPGGDKYIYTSLNKILLHVYQVQYEVLRGTN